jgi:hypothetical protein
MPELLGKFDVLRDDAMPPVAISEWRWTMHRLLLTSRSWPAALKIPLNPAA